MAPNKKFQAGFTLTELMVWVAISGFTAIIIGTLNNYVIVQLAANTAHTAAEAELDRLAMMINRDFTYRYRGDNNNIIQLHCYDGTSNFKGDVGVYVGANTCQTSTSDLAFHKMSIRVSVPSYLKDDGRARVVYTSTCDARTSPDPFADVDFNAVGSDCLRKAVGSTFCEGVTRGIPKISVRAEELYSANLANDAGEQVILNTKVADGTHADEAVASAICIKGDTILGLYQVKIEAAYVDSARRVVVLSRLLNFDAGLDCDASGVNCKPNGVTGRTFQYRP